MPFLNQNYSSIGEAIAAIYQYSLGLAGFLVFGSIVYAAILYTVSAGDPARQGEAKSRITSALFGLGLLLAAYLILYTVNPKLVRLQDPSGPDPAPTVLPPIEEQAAENRQSHTFEGSVETALKNPDLFFESAAIQEGFLMDQIAKESAKPNPDEKKLRDWMQSYEDLHNIKAEVKRRSNPKF